jgi:hypothetical protein
VKISSESIELASIKLSRLLRHERPGNNEDGQIRWSVIFQRIIASRRPNGSSRSLKWFRSGSGSSRPQQAAHNRGVKIGYNHRPKQVTYALDRERPRGKGSRDLRLFVSCLSHFKWLGSGKMP